MRRLRSKQYWKSFYFLSYGKVKLVYCHNVEEYHRKKRPVKFMILTFFYRFEAV